MSWMLFLIVPSNVVQLLSFKTFSSLVTHDLFVGKFVIGRVIKAMQANWHPDCFRCEICTDGLADSGFVKNAGR